MRAQGWEARLAQALEAARARPYRLGESDCFWLACSAVQALTGVDRWPEFSGQYRTKGQARRLIARFGSSFDAAFSWFFGGEPLPVAQARRGDVLKFVDDAGEAHLGICVGPHAAVYGPKGLMFVPRSACACAWRVG
jgi:hypothetical protein